MTKAIPATHITFNHIQTLLKNSGVTVVSGEEKVAEGVVWIEFEIWATQFARRARLNFVRNQNVVSLFAQAIPFTKKDLTEVNGFVFKT